MVVKYPKDVTDTMRDCILSIFWPKEQIISFFKNNGCTSHDLRLVENYKNENLSRARIIDIVFEALHERSDGGLGQFRAILKSLIEWDYFDPYYFVNLKQLDEQKARRLINHLRQIQEIRDAKKETAKRKFDKMPETPKMSLQNILDEYLCLFSKTSINRQDRGYKLEKILRDIAQLEGLEISDSFKVKGEQIDGSVKFDGEHYLVEAKWQDKHTASNALYQFAHKIEGKMYGRGLFVSINCFSPESVEALRVGKALKTILIDGGDLIMVLEGHLTFCQLLNAKIKAAQTQGRIYINPITNVDK